MLYLRNCASRFWSILVFVFGFVELRIALRSLFRRRFSSVKLVASPEHAHGAKPQRWDSKHECASSISRHINHVSLTSPGLYDEVAIQSVGGSLGCKRRGHRSKPGVSDYSGTVKSRIACADGCICTDSAVHTGPRLSRSVNILMSTCRRVVPYPLTSFQHTLDR